MTTLICFGFGYCAEHFVAAFGNQFDHIIGTVRGAERAAILNAANRTPARARVRRSQGDAGVKAAIAEAEFALVSAPPGAAGDPTLAACAETLDQAKHLRSVVYLSTVGVYGDHAGAWVDETTPPRPDAGRSRERLVAEQAWKDFGAQRGIAVASSASPAFTGRDRMRSSKSRAAKRAAS